MKGLIRAPKKQIMNMSARLAPLSARPRTLLICPIYAMKTTQEQNNINSATKTEEGNI